MRRSDRGRGNREKRRKHGNIENKKKERKKNWKEKDDIGGGEKTTIDEKKVSLRVILMLNSIACETNSAIIDRVSVMHALFLKLYSV